MGVSLKEALEFSILFISRLRHLENCSFLFWGVRGCVSFWNLFFIMLMRSAARHAPGSFQFEKGLLTNLF